MKSRNCSVKPLLMIVLLLCVVSLMCVAIISPLHHLHRPQSIGCLADGVYYYTIPGKGLYCYSPEEGFRLLLRNDSMGSNLAERDGRLYYSGHNKTVFCYDPATGEDAPATDLTYDILYAARTEESFELLGMQCRLLGRHGENVVFYTDLAGEYTVCFYDGQRVTSLFPLDSTDDCVLDDQWMYYYRSSHGGRTDCYRLYCRPDGSLSHAERIDDDIR